MNFEPTLNYTNFEPTLNYVHAFFYKQHFYKQYL